MIAAVIGTTAGATRECLRSVMAAAGALSADVLSDSATAIAASGGQTRGHLDRPSAVAWTGWRRPDPGATRPPYKLRGDVAAIVLRGPDDVLLMRGPFGGRPLYYTSDPRAGWVLACSRLAPLVSVVKGRRPSREWLSAYVAGQWLTDPERTQYEGIFRVPAAAVLRVGSSGVRERHAIPFDVVPVRSARVEALAAELRSHILQAVSRSIQDADDISLLVSGGLDSSGVLAATLQAVADRRRRVRVFTLDCASPGDDRPHFAALCRFHGIVPIGISPADCARGLRDGLVVDETPANNPTLNAVASILRTHEVRLLLTGNGGDDVLGGDMRVFVDRASRGDVVGALVRAARLRAWGRSTPAGRIRSLVLRPLLRRMLPERVLDVTGARAHPRFPAWAGPELRRTLRSGAIATSGPPKNELSSERSWLGERSRSSLYLEDSDARAQTEMVGGFSRVDPLLDPELIDFVASLQPELLFHDNWLRGLYREALRGWVPESLRMRPDKGTFGTAFRDMVGGPEGIADALGDLARCEHLADLDIVEPRALAERFQQLVRSPDAPLLWAELWPVLSAEAFLQETRRASS